MLTLPQLKGADLLTHSRMSCAKTCARKHLYRYGLGWRKRGEDSTPLRRGGAVHVGLEALANGLPDWIERATASYAGVEYLQQEAVEIEAMLAGYHSRWWEAEPTLDGQWVDCDVAEFVAVEIPFQLPIINPATGRKHRKYRLAGKIDAIVTLADGRMAVMEHKTHKGDLSPSANYWKRLELDHQISAYYYAARHLGYPVQTVLYNVLRTPELSRTDIPVRDENGLKIVHNADGSRAMLDSGKPRQVPLDGQTAMTRPETLDEFAARLAMDIAERPDTYYARKEISRLEHDIRSFKEELWDYAQQLQHAEKKGWHSRNTGACLNYNTLCDYHKICMDDITEQVPDGYIVVDDLHPELETA